MTIPPRLPEGLRVEVRRSPRRTRTIQGRREGNAIVVSVPARLSAAETQRAVDEMVAKILARETRRRTVVSEPELLARATMLARRHLDEAVGHPVRPTAIRWVGNQQRRWGSCTPATGEIRLSTALQEMPAWVVDYVIVHELVHLVEANHDARFWALTSRYPRMERARGFLEGWATARQLDMGEDA